MEAVLKKYINHPYSLEVLTIITCVAVAFCLSYNSRLILTRSVRTYLGLYSNIGDNVISKHIFISVWLLFLWLLLFITSEVFLLKHLPHEIVDFTREVLMYTSFLTALFYLQRIQSQVSLYTFLVALALLVVTIVSSFDFAPLLIKVLDKYYITIGQYRISIHLCLKELFILFIAVWIVHKFSAMLRRYFHSLSKIDSNTKELLSKCIAIILYSTTIFTIMNSLGVNLTSLTVITGTLGVGIAVGLQEISANFISGIILLMEKTIKVGDLVQLSDGTLGYIKRHAARYTLVDVGDGREIIVPNTDFVTSPIINYTHSNKKVCVTIAVVIEYNTDIEQVMTIMINSAKQHPRSSTLIGYEPCCIIDQFKDYGISLILSFWVDDVFDGMKIPKSEVMQAIINCFKNYHIKFAVTDA